MSCPVTKFCMSTVLCSVQSWNGQNDSCVECLLCTKTWYSECTAGSSFSHFSYSPNGNSTMLQCCQYRQQGWHLTDSNSPGTDGDDVLCNEREQLWHSVVLIWVPCTLKVFLVALWYFKMQLPAIEI